MSKNLEKIINVCPECGGEGVLSECCSNYIEDSRCLDCGRYSRTDCCHECNGEGVMKYEVGTEVEIFVCVWSSLDIQLELDYHPEAVGDTKTFKGKISDIVDEWNVKVRIGRKKYNVSVEELTLI